MTMIRLLLTFGLLVLSTVSFSASITLNYDESTTREDGSLITGAKTYNLYHKIDNNPETVITIDGSVTTHIIDDVATGVHGFRISTVEDAQEGAISQQIIVNVTDIPVSEPTAPTTFSFSFSCTGEGCTQEVR